MDPLSAMLLAMWIAGYFTRNTVQDLVWKARGEDPPSVRREQARRERRAERASDPGPGRRFWGNVWADAVASAEERRARWAEQDVAAAEDEAYVINERLDAAGDTGGPAEPAEPAPVVHDQVVWSCRGCGTRMCNAGTDPYERGEELCRACRALEENAAAPRRCHFCHYSFPTTGLWPTRTTDGRTVGACPDCWHDQHAHRPDPAAADSGDQPEPSPAADPEPGDAEIIQFADWQRPATGSTEKENDMSAEITGLQSAIAYAEGSAAAAERAAAQDEMAIAGLQAGGTTGVAITSFQASMEGHTQNAAHYRAAAAELTRQLQVKEAYEANQGAGEKTFVTSE